MADRLRAFSIHFSLSLLVALVSLLLVFWIWYPGPLSAAMGVTQIFLLMLLVDITLGPVLTFAVFRKGKKTLKFDLAVIVTLQIGALVYGLQTVAEGRPVWLVYTVDRFEAVRPVEMDPRFPEKVAAEYASPSWTGPRWVAAVRPNDSQAAPDILFESLLGGLDLQHRPYLYRPLGAAVVGIRTRALPLEELKDFNSPERVTAVLDQWPGADAWLPMKTSARSVVVLVKRQSGEVVTIVDLAPWE